MNKLISLKKGNNRFGVILLLPASILLFVFFVYPILYSFYLSMTNANYFLPDFHQKFIGLSNYLKLFTEKDFMDSIKITFIYATVSTAVKLLLGFILALLFQRDIKGFGFFRAVIILPMVITPVAAGLIWNYMYNQTFGLVNFILNVFHIPSLSWHTEPPTALLTIILVDIWILTPFVLIVTMAGLTNIPKELYEAAHIDGASWWSTLTNIIIPYMKPIIVIVILLNLIDAFKVFDQVWIMTRGGPALRTNLFTIYAYKEAMLKGNIGLGSAASIIVLIILIIISLIFIKSSRVNY